MQLLLLLSLLCACATATTYSFGSYYRPFSAQSPWNSMPVNPVFMIVFVRENVLLLTKIADHSIYYVPTDAYYPTIAAGQYSLNTFLTNSSDGPMTIYPGSSGLQNADSYDYMTNITLPHFPTGTTPASGGDGHCDIYDTTLGVVHSFWQLRQPSNATGGKWVASVYAWAPLDGYGFGEPAHYYVGGRAAGVPSSAGLIRIHEVDDGLTYFQHALTMSMTYSALAGTNKAPGYQYPATSTDGTYNKNNGSIPEGALMMLPSTYNYTGSSVMLRKVIETLKIYGAYVVDRNDGTPYVIYVENNSTFKLYNGSWDNAVESELQKVRSELRMVDINATSFVDGNGSPLGPRKNVNYLSMRGPSQWGRTKGDGWAAYDTKWSQRLNLTASTSDSYFYNRNGYGYNRFSWGSLIPKQNYTFVVESDGGVRIGLIVVQNGVNQFNTTYLADGERCNFTYPAVNGSLTIIVYKPAGPSASGRGLIYLSNDVPAPAAPTSVPTTTPTSSPTTAPTTKPTTSPTTAATVAPTVKPTSTPTAAAPTTAPTVKPTSAPTAAAPTTAPTTKPTSSATTASATAAPTSKPTTSSTTSKAAEDSSASPDSVKGSADINMASIAFVLLVALVFA